MIKKFKIILLSFFMIGGCFSWAQDSDIEELNLIEMELDRNPAPPEAEDSNEANTSNTEISRPPTLEEKKSPEVMTYEDLGKLSDFRQVSVIQKRYLPRTGRFQFFVAPTLTLNDPWFNIYGATLRLGYNLREAWGLEVGYSSMSTNKTQALRELNRTNGVVTDNFVYTKSYYSVDLNWTPLYGKMTWLDQRIVYYDTYFAAGFGGTEIQTHDVQSTIHLGFGQIFSISKKMAFRWDLSWNFFDAKQIDQSNGSYNNVFLSAGFSFFFPEATYR